MVTAVEVNGENAEVKGAQVTNLLRVVIFLFYFIYVGLETGFGGTNFC